MQTSNMKNILVLKDLPSNIVEEAIVVIKPNIKIKDLEYIEEKSKNSNFKNPQTQNMGEKKNQGYVIKEAEMLITDYINQVERPKEVGYKIRKLTKKYERWRKISFLLGAVVILSFIINLI